MDASAVGSESTRTTMASNSELGASAIPHSDDLKMGSNIDDVLIE
jgi:hypothetical protein